MATEKSANDYVVMDHLIHDKLSSGEEVILLPITKYDNVIGAPGVISDLNELIAAPFSLYAQDEVEISSDLLEEITGIQASNI